MPRRTGKLSNIMGQSAAEISDLSGSEARAQYNYLRKVIREREKGFAKAGKQGRFDRQYGIMGPPSLRGLDDKQVKKQIGRMVRQLSGRESTISGVQKALQENNRHRKQGLEKVLGRSLSDKEWDAFGRFLGAMQERHGDNWKNVSDDFIEMLDTPGFAEALTADREGVTQSVNMQLTAEQLGLKASQFMRNFDYWEAHEEELRKAKPIKGRKRKLTPSDYIKQLKLPSIKDWRAEQNDY